MCNNEQQIKEVTLPKLEGDGRRFQQVLINLVKNAMKFTNQGEISIQVALDELDPGMLIGHVRDSGAGIAEEDMPKLFSKFGKL